MIERMQKVFLFIISCLVFKYISPVCIDQCKYTSTTLCSDIFNMPATLRQTDFLPNRFDGSKLDSDLCTVQYLSFEDYLQAHDLQTPADYSALLNVVNIFKRTLQGSARLWIEDKTFVDLEDLKSKFIYRFSPSHSQFVNVKQFDSMSYNPGDKIGRAHV